MDHPFDADEDGSSLLPTTRPATPNQSKRTAAHVSTQKERPAGVIPHGP
ncbi:hypothetical protein [Thalassospira lucentensis]